MAPIKSLEVEQKEEVVEVSKSTLTSLLAEMKELKSKVGKLESVDDSGMKHAKDIYDGPLAASYRIWN